MLVVMGYFSQRAKAVHWTMEHSRADGTVPPTESGANAIASIRTLWEPWKITKKLDSFNIS